MFYAPNIKGALRFCNALNALMKKGEVFELFRQVDQQIDAQVERHIERYTITQMIVSRTTGEISFEVVDKEKQTHVFDGTQLDLRLLTEKAQRRIAALQAATKK